MMAIAPNLTTMVGELVGARLIAHAGSLLNLAKHPSSTVQILGAEKALFRALKTKHDTPKYGLIYHASLVGQAAPKNKGKISRMLAAKASLCVRVDALGDEAEPLMGIASRAMVEARVRQCEQGQLRRVSGTGKARAQAEKYTPKSTPKQYNEAADFTLSGKKRKRSKSEGDPGVTKTEGEEGVTSGKKRKRAESEAVGEGGGEEEKVVTPSGKKRKREVGEGGEEEAGEGEGEEGEGEDKTPSKKRKKEKKKMKKERDFDFGQGEEDVAETPVKTEPEETETPVKSEKKKKKKKAKQESE
ncbi:Nucleolar protein 58 [Geodia barretti]|nr:Nucleolar protein 58 [Geodia barretti]